MSDISKTNLTQDVDYEDSGIIWLNQSDSPQPTMEGYLTGSVQFIVSLLVTFVNLVFLFLLNRSKLPRLLRFLLSTIAVADLLTALTYLPSATENYFRPELRHMYPWCWIRIFVAPTRRMCHATSVWLTVLLGVFRYISVCHPTKATRLCRYSAVVKATVLVVVICGAFYVAEPFKYRIQTVKIFFADTNRTTVFCDSVPQAWAGIYSGVRRILLVVFIRFIPYVSQLVITCRLIYTIRKANRTRNTLTNRATEQPDANQGNTNVFLAALLSSFLLGETPLMLDAIMMFLLPVLPVGIFGDLFPIVFQQLTYNFLLITCSFNFCVYCMMGRNFRSGLKRHCCYPQENN